MPCAPTHSPSLTHTPTLLFSPPLAGLGEAQERLKGGMQISFVCLFSPAIIFNNCGHLDKLQASGQTGQSTQTMWPSPVRAASAASTGHFRRRIQMEASHAISHPPQTQAEPDKRRFALLSLSLPLSPLSVLRPTCVGVESNCRQVHCHSPPRNPALPFLSYLWVDSEMCRKSLVKVK